MTKIVGLDGAPVSPENTKPTPQVYTLITVDGVYKTIEGVLGLNPIFVYVADESGNVKVLVPMDQLMMLHLGEPEAVQE